jgi:hypothetical protein
MAITGNSHRYRAHHKRNRILQHSRCGRIRRYEAHSRTNKTPSDDRRARDSSKDKRGRQRLSNSKVKGRMIHRRASFLVPATTTDLADKGESASWVVFSRRRATLKSSHPWVVLGGKLAQIAEPA